MTRWYQKIKNTGQICEALLEMEVGKRKLKGIILAQY